MIHQELKPVSNILMGLDTIDGAGVKLKRMFGGMNSSSITDPFLLLDQFGSTLREDYISGFPWHPHRGIETVTYLLDGKVTHMDSEGHSGTIHPDEVQWMTSGSGIFHQEMPDSLTDADIKNLTDYNGIENAVKGFQLWINIPAIMKMETPSYRSITRKQIPVINDKEGNTVKIIAGEYEKNSNELPMKPLIDPMYIDVSMPPESIFDFDVKPGHTSIINLISGQITGLVNYSKPLKERSAVVFSREGRKIHVETGNEGGRFILITGKPLNERIYWHGPIVMNTEDQIREALSDLRNNRFVREKNPMVT